MSRECGSCRACCFAVPILEPELTKPGGEWCKHVGPKGAPGCTIYSQRPPVCSGYKCLWLADETLLPDEYQPNRIGFIVEFSEQRIDGKLCLYLREFRPGALKTLAAIRMGKRLMDANFVVFVVPLAGEFYILNPGYDDAVIVNLFLMHTLPKRSCCGRQVVDMKHRGHDFVVEPTSKTTYLFHEHKEKPPCTSPTSS